VTLDGRKDTAYIYLKDFEDEEVACDYILVEHVVAGDLKFEFDKEGRLLGIEVKFAPTRFRPVFSSTAVSLDAPSDTRGPVCGPVRLPTSDHTGPCRSSRSSGLTMRDYT